MGRYDGWVLFSDVDGTLMTDRFTVPEKNLEALRRFTAEGGLFALATGRGMANTRELARQLYANAPCVLLNGGVIHDYQQEKTLHEAFLPSSAHQTLRRVLDEWPDIRAVVWTGGVRYDVGAVPDNSEDIPAKPLDELMGLDWHKAIFTLPIEQRDVFWKRLTELSGSGLRTTVSSEQLVELLPASASKGDAVEFLIQWFGWPRERVVAVGDYLNDYEMLAQHGLRSFCTANAHPDILACSERLCHVDDGALAELIERL